MKLKTKLWITFIIIVILPILLTTIAYLVIGASVVLDMRDTYGEDSISFSFASNPASAYDEIIDEHYEVIKEYAWEEPEKLEDKEVLQNIEEDNDNNIKVYIGKENNIDEDVTVIKTKFKNGNEEGTLAIIGPKRMEYDRVVSMLEYMKENIER